MTDSESERGYAAASEPGDARWERDTLREVALEGIKERRRARRWGIFFKLLLALYLFAVLGLALRPGALDSSAVTTEAHTAVVNVQGMISSDSPANAERVIAGLEDAFANEDVEGVILRINSPGGSPVQSGRINDAMQRLREEHPDTPLYAVAGDLLASGAYYIAAGADRIYADKASIVGSIGVLMGSFGFNDAMERIGVERRLYTAGRNKALLDPFSEAQERHVEHVQGMLDGIHQQFIDVVRQGRGDRLEGDPDKLFSGLYWTGEKGVSLGLVDELAGPREVAADVIGAELTVDYTPQQSLFQKLADRVGSAAGRFVYENLIVEPGSVR
jgi:protease-4